MIGYILVIVGLFICVGCLLAHIFLLKRNIKDITSELKRNRESSYNREIRLALHDRDTNALAVEINNNLSYQKKLKLSYETKSRELEQSIADITHDLRTPLTVVKGNLQMLTGETLSDKGREYLQAGMQRTDSLKNMVDEFFELTLLESDDRPADTESVDLVGFLTDTIIHHEVMIREHGLTPNLVFPKKRVDVRANREMLGRVFSNLLTNITKYARDSFTLAVEESDSGTPCTVRLMNALLQDQAPDVDHIFDRTYRADRARSDGSAGLGLSIVKLLMEKMGGGISAAIDDGNLTFTIIFAG